MKKTLRLIIALLSFVIGISSLAGPFTAKVYAEERPALESTSTESKIAMSFSHASSPVDTVVGASEILGFNPKVDTFTLISETPSLAVVRVVHNGISFNITLEPSLGSSWEISSMHTNI